MSRDAYKTLAEERIRINSAFGRIPIDREMVSALPEHGAPQEFLECAVHMPEVERYTATRRGPGTIRDPLDVAQSDDDASDELGDESSNERLAKEGS